MTSLSMMTSDWLKMRLEQQFHLTHKIDSVHKTGIPEIVCHKLFSDIQGVPGGMCQTSGECSLS
jgi:hypothetical protein